MNDNEPMRKKERRRKNVIEQIRRNERKLRMNGKRRPRKNESNK